MKRVLLSIMALTIAIVMCRAERNVSTEPECKNVLIEEFTGISCGYCPQAHKIVADLIKVQPENVFAIAVHAGQFARPNSDEPDFRTSSGTEINDYFAISGYPAGMVNRQRVDDRITISRYSWATFSRQLIEELAPVNLWMESTYDDATRTLTVNVEGYYTADVDAQSNYLNVVLTQNNIMGPQKGAGMGSEYMHQHMARVYLTSTWGDEISSCKKGDFFSKQYVYTLPSDINDVEVNPAEIEVVVFVTEDKENVLNVTGGHPELVGVTLPLAAEIAQPLIPMNGTWGYDYFEFDLTNKSSEAITSATFNVSFNSVDYTVEWSGVVDPRSTATIRLPFDVAGLSKATNNKYVIKTTALNGTEFTSNKLADKFNAPLTITPTVMVEYCLDDYADENHIVIKDMEGNVVKEFGPYEAGELAYIVTKEMASLEANTRYCLEVTDAWANGIYEGYLNLYDANNTLVEKFKRIEEHGVRVFFNTVASNASTEVQKKKVFLEDFTGIHCGNCPDAHYRITELLKAQGDKVYATAIHAGHYAEPFPGEPDFRTPQGDSLDIYFETPGYPSGMINRTIFDGETEPMTARNKWVEYARLICDQDAPVNLWLSSVYNPDSRELTVVVEGYYTADVDADFNMLNILITQSGIRGPQNGGSAGNNYIHEHVARVYLTPVWGDTIASCKQGDTFKKQYVYVVPNDINGVATDIANSEVLAYVCKDKTDVLNIIGVHPEYPGLVIPMNAEIQQPLIPITGTYAYNYYEVLFKNNSTEDVVNAGFEIDLNGTKYTTEWTGLVPARSTALIQVPFNQSDLIKSANDFTLKLTSINNQSYNGNSISGDFQDPVETTPFNKFIIKTDTYADENRYLIKDMAGKVVHEFGPYPLGVVTEVTEELMLDKDQTYCLEITDAWGNGIYIPRGTCKIYNAAGKLVSQLLEIKDHGIRSFFTTSVESAVEAISADNAYTVQYNKANKAIQVVANGNEAYSVAVYNAAGQCVYATQAAESISAPISVQGVYVVEVTSATAHEVAKVAVY